MIFVDRNTFWRSRQGTNPVGTMSQRTEGMQAGCLSTEAQEQSDLVKAQQEDEAISHIRQAHLHGEKDAPGRSLAEWELLRGSWAQLEIRADVVGMRTKYAFRALVPKAMRSRVMKLAHDHPTSGHLGRGRTTEKIRQHFLWPGMYADIRRYCTSCDLCQRRHRPAPKQRAPMVTEVASQPFHRIAIDITEMPVSVNGNRYAVVIMDYFSKFVRVYPVRRQDAETVTTVLLDWVYDMGVPSKIHSDQGGQFESDLFQQMCRRLGIQKTRTTPYHPESDGMVERFMRTLKDMVAKYVDPHGLYWDKDIKAYTMAYNSSVHSVTGYSPYFMLHGFNPRTPLLAAVNLPDSAVPIRSFLDERLRAISEAYKVAEKRTQESAERTAARYNEHASGNIYAIGDRVWIRDNRVSVGGKPKLGLYYRGPGTIVSHLGGITGVTYRVRDDKGRERVLHFNQLKPMVEREVPHKDYDDRMGDTPRGTEGTQEPPSESVPRDTELITHYYLSRRCRNPVVGEHGPLERRGYVTRSWRLSRPPVRFPS